MWVWAWGWAVRLLRAGAEMSWERTVLVACRAAAATAALIPLFSRRVDCLAEWIRRDWMEMDEENEGFLCKHEVELLLCVGCISDGQK